MCNANRNSNCFSVSSIGCFVCSSVNRSNPECEDTFDGNMKYYHKDCTSGRKERNGRFPASACIKMVAEISEFHFSCWSFIVKYTEVSTKCFLFA